MTGAWASDARDVEEPWAACAMQEGADYGILELRSPSNGEAYLAARDENGWRLVALIGADYSLSRGDPNEFFIDGVKFYRVPGGTVIEVRTSYIESRSDSASPSVPADRAGASVGAGRRGDTAQQTRYSSAMVCAKPSDETGPFSCIAFPTASTEPTVASFSFWIDELGVLTIIHKEGTLEGDAAELPGRYRLF